MIASMTLSWHELVTAATDSATALLEKSEGDWSRPAGTLEWSCQQTVSHLSQAVTGYAGLLIAQPKDRYITLMTHIDAGAPADAKAEGIRIAGRMLAGVVRETSPEARAWHPWGTSDVAGFSAMAVTELLLHSRDIALTFGLDWEPSDELCAPVLERIFPGAPTGHGAAETLLWSTGRGDLPGLERPAGWRWYGDVR